MRILTILFMVLLIFGTILVEAQDEDVDPTPTQEVTEKVIDKIEVPPPLDVVEIENIFDFDTDGIDIQHLAEMLVKAAIVIGLTVVFLVGSLKHLGTWLKNQYKWTNLDDIPAWKLRLITGVVLLVVIAFGNVIGKSVETVGAINWFVQGFIPLIFVALGVFGGSQGWYVAAQKVHMPLLGYQRPDPPAA